MARGKVVKQHKFYQVSPAVCNGRYGFKATCTTASGLFDLGFFTRADAAARAADLANLALGRKGPLNYNKRIYLKKDVAREKERLKQLGVFPAGAVAPAVEQQHRAARVKSQPAAGVEQPQPTGKEQLQQPQDVKTQGTKKDRKSKHKTQQLPGLGCTAGQPPAEPEQPKGHKRKAADTDHPDATATVTLQQKATATDEAQTKRQKVRHQQEVPASLAAPEEAPTAAPKPSRKQPHGVAASGAAAAAAGSLTAAGADEAAQATQPSLALVPAAAPQMLLPTGAAMQLGPPGSNQVVIMQQLRSALAAHEASKRQLHAALQALEASEGQLAAVARAAGLV